MAGTTGLEPATSDVTGRRSNQLSYVPAGWSLRSLTKISHLPLPESDNRIDSRRALGRDQGRHQRHDA
jgi:hypothetical protein